MAKTKTFGVRLSPDLIAELERLRDLFAFNTSGEMMESWVRLLQGIDESVSQIKKHPREWDALEVEDHLGLCARRASAPSHIDSLTLRRLRERFGEDGIQRIQELLQELRGRQHGKA